jgi:hypothetical protein
MRGGAISRTPRAARSYPETGISGPRFRWMMRFVTTCKAAFVQRFKGKRLLLQAGRSHVTKSAVFLPSQEGRAIAYEMRELTASAARSPPPCGEGSGVGVNAH